MTPNIPPQEVVRRFFPDSPSTKITTLGQGNINDTFLVCAGEKSIVLQRINSHVFPNPDILINNLRCLSLHLSSHQNTVGQRWEETKLIPATEDALSVRDSEGAVWRALSYIENSTCFSSVGTPEQAEQVGWALGHFHKRLTGLDVHNMQIPLPGFHNLANYLKQYTQLDIKNKEHNSSEQSFCTQAIKNNLEKALVLENTYSKKNDTLRIIHGDPKIANILFDKKNGRAISLIDLDTVGPGLPQHDIGDCLRSVCNSGGEEGTPDDVMFDLNLCKITMAGYFKAAPALLTPNERALIYDGITAITYELGLRFFMDYLRGGIYFKCETPKDILKKAFIQFSLLQDLIAKEDAIRKLTRI